MRDTYTNARAWNWRDRPLDNLDQLHLRIFSSAIHCYGFWNGLALVDNWIDDGFALFSALGPVWEINARVLTNTAGNSSFHRHVAMAAHTRYAGPAPRLMVRVMQVVREIER